jgi:superfamily I DNA/RNA helicase
MVPMLRKVTTAEQFIDVVSPQIPEELADRLLGAITEDFRAAYDGLVRAEEQSATPEESALLPARSPKLDKAVHRALASRPETSWAALADAQQLMIAQGSFDGPVLVTGAAGTGKSVVGLHRARHLAESGRHVRLTTYTNSLCDYLRRQLDSACSKRARSRISVDTVDRTAFYICGLPDLHGLDESERFDAMAMKAAALVVEGGVDIAFDALVVDEVQDLGPARLAFLQALIESGCNDAMLLADSSQRIYGEPFDLEDLGFDFAGREFHLETAYRTTQEIMDLASSVVVCEANDARPPIAYASGPAPRLLEFKDRETEVAWVSLEILRLVLREQVPSERIAVLARRNSSLRRYRGHLYHEFSLSTYGDDAIVQLMTMHAAKGLEFDAVFVVDVSDGEVPSGPALADGHASGCAQDALVRERNVLHTAVSRACDRVYVTWAGSPSSLLEPALAASGGPEHAGVSEHDEFVEWLETHEEA